MNLENISKKELSQYYLNIIYNNVQAYHEQNHIYETSGEILYSSINKLFSIFPLNEQDVFVDLGSGIGKIVLQIFLTTPVKKAYGIEIVNESYQRALMAAQKIRKDLPDFYSEGRELHFLLGNFLENSLEGTTVALVNSICLNQKVVSELGKILNNTSSIHTVFTLRPMPTLKRLRFKRTIRIECSWDTVLCYVYGL
ncbi:MAG: class I SAM-dependent methyltransferase [Gammaproteobacteria bacterium]